MPLEVDGTSKLEKNSDGKVERYKSRFRAKGFTLVEGIDFNET
jgi:hypothetical protein